MSPSVLLSQRGGSRVSRLVVGNSLGAYARFLANRISIIPRVSIKVLDRILRHLLGIQEFSREPGCILRYSRTRSRMGVTLPRGEIVRSGDPILELHFWNERLGTDSRPRSSPTALRSALRQSLALLAEQLQSDEHFADIKAVHATLARIPSRSCHIHHPFGCTVNIEPCSTSRRTHDFLENFLIHSLRWAFNPRQVKQRSFRLSRLELWISVSDLKARFSDPMRADIAWAGTLGELCLSEHYAPGESETAKAAGD